MSSTIRMKRSAVAGKIPAAADLVPGELALNTADGKLFMKKADGEVVGIGSKSGMTVASGNVLARAGDDILLVADTAVTVTLPAAPDAGDMVAVMRAGEGVVTVLRNGSAIHGAADDLVIDLKNRRVRLIYAGGTWRVTMEGALA